MKYKIGDRVAVYDGECARMRRTGTVKALDVPVLIIKLDSPGLSETYAHPKQCRRLIKKARRRVFIWGNDADLVLKANAPVSTVTCASRAVLEEKDRLKATGDLWVEFIEVKRRGK